MELTTHDSRLTTWEEYMRENKVKRLLREGAVTIGTWVTLDGLLAAEVMAARGFDWLVIDMEHGPVSMDAALGRS